MTVSLGVGLYSCSSGIRRRYEAASQLMMGIISLGQNYRLRKDHQGDQHLWRTLARSVKVREEKRQFWLLVGDDATRAVLPMGEREER